MELPLPYSRSPTTPLVCFVPTHEAAEDPNLCASGLCQRLSFGATVSPTTGARETFHNPKAAVTAKNAEGFCDAADEQGEALKTAREGVQRMDSVVVTGYQVFPLHSGCESPVS